MNSQDTRCPLCGKREADCGCCPECGHVCARDRGEVFCSVCMPEPSTGVRDGSEKFDTKGEKRGRGS